MPSAYYGNSGTHDVSSAVDEARKKGIEVVSIFFTHDQSYEATEFKQMYKRNAIITQPEKITNELVKVLKRFINF